MNYWWFLPLLAATLDDEYDIISLALIDDSYDNLVRICMGRIYNIHIHPNQAMARIRSSLIPHYSVRHMTLCTSCSYFYLNSYMFMRLLVSLLILSILSACTLPGTQSENTT